MSKSVFVIDKPKSCLHCKMRRVIHIDREHNYQLCGLDYNHGYGCEAWFTSDDLTEDFISDKCPLEDLNKFINKKK